jgi:hypothetical protein
MNQEGMSRYTKQHSALLLPPDPDDSPSASRQKILPCWQQPPLILDKSYHNDVYPGEPLSLRRYVPRVVECRPRAVFIFSSTSQQKFETDRGRGLIWPVSSHRLRTDVRLEFCWQLCNSLLDHCRGAMKEPVLPSQPIHTSFSVSKSSFGPLHGVEEVDGSKSRPDPPSRCSDTDRQGLDWVTGQRRDASSSPAPLLNRARNQAGNGRRPSPTGRSLNGRGSVGVGGRLIPTTLLRTAPLRVCSTMADCPTE